MAFSSHLLSGQMDSGDCTSSKEATSGKSQLMAMFQSPVPCRKGGLGCLPISRLLQCRWKMETSTSLKVSAPSQLRLRWKCPPTMSPWWNSLLNLWPRKVGVGSSKCPGCPV